MLSVTALYHFVRIDDVDQLRARLFEIAQRRGIKGTLILAEEGINGTICGTDEALDELLQVCQSIGCPNPRRDPVSEVPFRRLFIHKKNEIVTMGVRGIDPTRDRGVYVDPEQWNELIDNPNIIVIDTRNDFEVRLGTFESAENPNTVSFRQFPQWVNENKARLERAEGVAMFCTGGIRCEKATSYLTTMGIERTYHLKGGILRYLKETDKSDSRFSGDCFVFDERIAVGHELTINHEITMCYGCRHPVDETMRADPRYEEGVSCPDCFADTSDEQKAKFRMRSQQFKDERVQRSNK
ncbi:MAG: rhodanese-related sulfurtransferase [Bradymonadia bacterium]